MKINIKKIKNFRIPSKYKKYLPSKNFVRVVGSGAAFIFVVSLIFSFGNSKESFFRSNNSLITKDTTIDSLLQTDTDGDGVYDWEEAMWGTDINKKATFNETPDLAFIQQRKDALGLESEQNDKALNETDQFAREFFASYLALKTAGQDQEAINKFSKSIGEKVNNTKLVDVYSEADVKLTTNNDFEAKKTYYTAVQTSFDKYREMGIGEELDIVNKGLLSYTQGNSKVDYGRLKSIGQSYQDFAKVVIETKVPKSYVEQHLAMANAAHNTGSAVLSMASVIEDPLVGLTGLNQYDAYSKDFMQSVENLEADLLEEIDNIYGINPNNTDSEGNVTQDTTDDSSQEYDVSGEEVDQ